jgi:hypothetical protein
MREKKSSYIAFFVHGYMVYLVLAVCTCAGFYSKVYRYCIWLLVWQVFLFGNYMPIVQTTLVAELLWSSNLIEISWKCIDIVTICMYTIRGWLWYFLQLCELAIHKWYSYTCSPHMLVHEVAIWQEWRRWELDSNRNLAKSPCPVVA